MKRSDVLGRHGKEVPFAFSLSINNKSTEVLTQDLVFGTISATIHW